MSLMDFREWTAQMLKDDDSNRTGDKAPPVFRMEIIPPKTDVKRELTGIALTLGLTIGIYIIQRRMADPDFFKTMQMRCLANAQTYCDSRARFWHSLSARATDQYLSMTAYGAR